MCKLRNEFSAVLRIQWILSLELSHEQLKKLRFLLFWNVRNHFARPPGELQHELRAIAARLEAAADAFDDPEEGRLIYFDDGK